MFQHRRIALVILACMLLGPIGEGHANDTQTVGLFLNAPGSFDGYTVIAPNVYPQTWLINNMGLVCHSWSHTGPAASVHLLENGDLLRNGLGGPGSSNLERWDWDGNLVWSYNYTDDPPVYPHHDFEFLPNGNIVILAWETKYTDEAIANGRDPATLHPTTGELWPEHLVEIQPVGADSAVIVWEWHVWDHLIQDFDSTKANFGVVADHPELMDLNFFDGVVPQNPYADWTHANTVKYNAELDQLVISHNALSEFWIIDHSTTTEEAAGHTGGLRGMGGDILYRWGNPEAYDRGNADDRRLFTQHQTQWIPDGYPGAGNILLFSNGAVRPDSQYSSIMEIQTTVDPSGNYPVPLPGEPHGPPEAVWEYIATPPDSLYSRSGSGCQRLPNGNTLMVEANDGRIREVDSSGQEVWKYVVPVNASGPVVQGTVLGFRENNTFRTWRYAPDYPGFEGRDLTPGAPIELNKPTPVLLSGFTAEAQDLTVLLSWFTSFEHLHDGFNIHRSTLLGSGFSKLNDDLIRGRNPYSYLDRGVQPSTTYYYKIGAVDLDGREVIHATTSATTPAWRTRTALSLGRPSPFRNETVLDFTLGAPTAAELAVYDVAGRLVRVLLRAELPQGEHVASWDGRDDSGLRVGGGTYLVKLTAGDVTQTRKVVFLGRQ